MMKDPESRRILRRWYINLRYLLAYVVWLIWASKHFDSRVDTPWWQQVAAAVPVLYWHFKAIADDFEGA